jgi:hypothetical protein
MTKKLTKSLSAVILVSLVIALSLAISTPVLAQTANSLIWGGQLGNVDASIDLGNEDPRVITAEIINVVLGFLGIITLLIIFFGVFKIATSGGGEDKVAEGKNYVIAGVIGLIIILASWGLATFIVNLLYNATA